jgi:hypothetical protein
VCFGVTGWVFRGVACITSEGSVVGIWVNFLAASGRMNALELERAVGVNMYPVCTGRFDGTRIRAIYENPPFSSPCWSVSFAVGLSLGGGHASNRSAAYLTVVFWCNPELARLESHLGLTHLLEIAYSCPVVGYSI